MKWSVISFALLVLASCQNKEYQPDPSNVGFFPEDTGEVRKPVQFTDAMAAAGARADATLGKHHFDGPRLNSLGEEKLALMLKDEHAPAPMTVYLNFGEKDETSTARQAAVKTFLKDKGLTDDQVRIAYGYNPDAWSPAAPVLTKMKSEAANADAPAANAAGGMTGGASPGGGVSGSDGGGLFSGAGK